MFQKEVESPAARRKKYMSLLLNILCKLLSLHMQNGCDSVQVFHAYCRLCAPDSRACLVYVLQILIWNFIKAGRCVKRHMSMSILLGTIKSGRYRVYYKLTFIENADFLQQFWIELCWEELQAYSIANLTYKGVKWRCYPFYSYFGFATNPGKIKPI